MKNIERERRERAVQSNRASDEQGPEKGYGPEEREMMAVGGGGRRILLSENQERAEEFRKNLEEARFCL